jgi:hypothetical protein
MPVEVPVAVGHDPKAVHQACSEHAEVTVPCLDDWERQWKKEPQEMEKPKVVTVDFQTPGAAPMPNSRLLHCHKRTNSPSTLRGSPVANVAKVGDC